MSAFLKRIGIDSYMLMLLATVMLGLVLPARGIAAEGLGHVTYWAVALLFFLYGAKLDPASVKAGMLNWRLQGLTFAATYAMFPLLGMGFAAVFGGLLGPQVTLGLLFLSVLPSTVQSSIAFVSIAGGNVPAAICAASMSNLVGVVLTPALVALLLHAGDGQISMDAVLRIGTQILLYASVAQLYNMSVRSTGLGWASGVGRIGAIVGPTLGGVLLAQGLPLGENFLIFAIPAAVSTIAMLVFALANGRGRDNAQLAAA